MQFREGLETLWFNRTNVALIIIHYGRSFWIFLRKYLAVCCFLLNHKISEQILWLANEAWAKISNIFCVWGWLGSNVKLTNEHRETSLINFCEEIFYFLLPIFLKIFSSYSVLLKEITNVSYLWWSLAFKITSVASPNRGTI